MVVVKRFDHAGIRNAFPCRLFYASLPSRMKDRETLAKKCLASAPGQTIGKMGIGRKAGVAGIKGGVAHRNVWWLAYAGNLHLYAK